MLTRTLKRLNVCSCLKHVPASSLMMLFFGSESRLNVIFASKKKAHNWIRQKLCEQQTSMRIKSNQRWISRSLTSPGITINRHISLAAIEFILDYEVHECHCVVFIPKYSFVAHLASDGNIEAQHRSMETLPARFHDSQSLVQCVSRLLSSQTVLHLDT